MVQAKGHFKAAEEKLNEIITAIFVDHVIEYAQSAGANDKSLNLFPDTGYLTMGPADGHRTALEFQGSGARRTMLWATLRYLSEVRNDSKRSNVLLIDEPELCLHPNAVREACRVLYDLASRGDWQVMITTHSPVFIDLSRDNTSIIRVERKPGGEIEGTTLYRPETAALSADDKENLKLLNIYDPYVAEFFFGGKIVVVEGDTEYAAFRLVIEERKEEFSNVHIIRARGKATIASVSKILIHFGATFSILHDSDTRTAQRRIKGSSETKTIANPAWGTNSTILDVVRGKVDDGVVRLVASINHFEAAFFDTALNSEKPYSAVAGLKTDAAKLELVACLLKALVDHSQPLPPGCAEWSTIEELEAAVPH